MTKTPKAVQTQDKFVVRLPDGMRDQIAAAAEAAGRSMNAEIVQRLADSMDPATAASHMIEIVTKANRVALACGMLVGQVEGAAGALEVEADLPAGTLTRRVSKDRNKLMDLLGEFEEAVNRAWSNPAAKTSKSR